MSRSHHPHGADRDADDDHAAMLRDIDAEVALTRHAIGKEALDPRVMAAMARVPRRRFVPAEYGALAFRDGPLPIGDGQTISQPYMVALMTDLLEPQADSIVLEIGTGSGYQAAVLAEIVRRVFSVEVLAGLAAAAGRRLAELGYDNVIVRHADGYLGWPEHAPYDGIVVTAAAPRIPPPLVEQLKSGAHLVIPVGYPGEVQVLKVLTKEADGTCSSRDVVDVAFVPLTRRGGAA